MSLRALVCVKAALDPVQPLHVIGPSPVVQAIDLPQIFALSTADNAAIEAALCLKEESRTHITALSLGRSECENVLRQCLAAGFEEAIHLYSDSVLGSNPWGVAKYVAAEISRRAYDLVLCGETSLDDASGVFGQFLSELLGWPLVFSAVELSIDEQSGHLVGLRLLEHGDRQLIACPLPAVVSINPLGYMPRYISVKRIGETDASSIQRKPIIEDLNESALKVVEIGPARLRPRRIAAPGARLSAAQRMQLMMNRGEGSTPTAKARVFEGSVEAAVDRIVRYLQEQGFL